MALSSIDPSTLVTMKLASELMTAQATIRHQRTQLAAMAVVLRAQQTGMASLADLIDALLSEPGDG